MFLLELGLERDLCVCLISLLLLVYLLQLSGRRHLRLRVLDRSLNLLLR